PDGCRRSYRAGCERRTRRRRRELARRRLIAEAEEISKRLMRLGRLNRLLLLKLGFQRRGGRGGGARCCRRAPARRRGGNGGVAFGLVASSLAARPGEIIGAPGRRAESLALDQRARGERIDRGRPRSRTAQ